MPRLENRDRGKNKRFGDFKIDKIRQGSYPGVLDLSSGGEVRPGPSNPDPV